MANRLNPNEQLSIGGSITSDDGRFTLILQSDGNLVIYGPGGIAVWATNTEGRSVVNAIMQSEGNFVIYGPGNAVIWASNTEGNPNAILFLQNDRNLVIYNSGGPIWASNTVGKEISVDYAPFALVANGGCTDDGRGNPRTQTGTYFRITGSKFTPGASCYVRAHSSGNVQRGIANTTADAAGNIFIKCYFADFPGPGEDLIFKAVDQADNGFGIATHSP